MVAKVLCKSIYQHPSITSIHILCLSLAAVSLMQVNLLFTTGLLLHSKNPSQILASTCPAAENRRLIVVYSCICCRIANEDHHYGHDDRWGTSWLFGFCIFFDIRVYCWSRGGSHHNHITNTRLLLSGKTTSNSPCGHDEFDS